MDEDTKIIVLFMFMSCALIALVALHHKALGPAQQPYYAYPQHCACCRHSSKSTTTHTPSPRAMNARNRAEIEAAYNYIARLEHDT
jgi:hypothetical protein